MEELITEQLLQHTDGEAYSCCGQLFPTLYEFRKHLFESHREEYDQIDPAVFHREIHPWVEKGSKAKINKRKYGKKGKRSDHSLSIYKVTGPIISTPMGGQPKKR